jgi:putative nucleotidyltransferase with HDIG domain
VSPAARFLAALAQALATAALYHEGHPARERSLDAAFARLLDLQSREPHQVFTFLGGEVVHGAEPLDEMRGWEWSERFVAAGVQRLEFDDRVERGELEEAVDDLQARLTSTGADSPELRQMRRTRVRIGLVGLRGEARTVAIAPPAPAPAMLGFSLADEAAAVRWMHDEVGGAHAVPLAEAEAVVRSLSLAMHGDRHVILPLLTLREFDEYTTTHALNVAVLSMALAERAGHAAQDVRACGVAGLLHDIGKVRIPPDILNKPGKLTLAEREVMNRHPVDGARFLLAGDGRMELAATVAYEHHLMHDGGGYPRLHWPRKCHCASRLAHVCDVYDALRTHRPYRPAWESERILTYIEARAGTEFDPEYAAAFVRMMREWETRTTMVEDAPAESASEAAAPDARWTRPADTASPTIGPGA